MGRLIVSACLLLLLYSVVAQDNTTSPATLPATGEPPAPESPAPTATESPAPTATESPAPTNPGTTDGGPLEVLSTASPTTPAETTDVVSADEVPTPPPPTTSQGDCANGEVLQTTGSQGQGGVCTDVANEDNFQSCRTLNAAGQENSGRCCCTLRDPSQPSPPMAPRVLCPRPGDVNLGANRIQCPQVSIRNSAYSGCDIVEVEGGFKCCCTPAVITSPPATAAPPPPTTVTPPPVTQLPSDAPPCSSAGATPTLCLRNGEYVGGRACGLTTESQTAFFLQNPGGPCSSNSECGSNQYCATLSPGTPTLCYPLAPRCDGDPLVPLSPPGLDPPSPSPPPSQPSPPAPTSASPPPPPATATTPPPPPPPANAFPPPPPATTPPPPPATAAAPPPPPRPLPPGVTVCPEGVSVPSPTRNCYLGPTGEYYGGIACGTTAEKQAIYLNVDPAYLGTPSDACNSSSACPSSQICATLAYAPSFCYTPAPSGCFA